MTLGKRVDLVDLHLTITVPLIVVHHLALLRSLQTVRLLSRSRQSRLHAVPFAPDCLLIHTFTILANRSFQFLTVESTLEHLVQ